MKKACLIALLGLMLFPVTLWAGKVYPKKGPVGITGWVIFWDAGNKSLAAFEKHADQVDRAYFEWCHLNAAGMPEEIADLKGKDELKARAMAAAAKNKVETWFMVGNYDVSINDHNKVFVQKMIYDKALRAKHIQWLIDYAKKTGVKGIQIDYENLLAKDKNAYSDFMAELYKACVANNLLLGQALPVKSDPEGTWDDPQARDYPALGRNTDEFVPMTYDLHWSTSTAGCVTSPEWTEMCIKYAVSVMDPLKVDVGYPAYGYDWVGNKGESITWQQFVDRAAKYKATPVRDGGYSQELFIDYTDEKGDKHEAWMPDSRSLEYQADIVKKYHIYGLGVWYFGSEDESFWTTMKKINATKATTSQLLPEEAAAPTKLGTKNILTDKQGVMYSYAYPDGISKVSIVDKQGKKWADVSLKGDAWSGFGMGVDCRDILTYVKKGAVRFYVRGEKGGEKFTVGFSMEKGLREDQKAGTTEVPITNYTKVTKKWTLVTIPLSDFPETGTKYDETIGEQQHGTFQWARVNEFLSSHAPDNNQWVNYQISTVQIVPSYNAREVEKAKNNSGD